MMPTSLHQENKAYRFSIAPMLDYTDSLYRVLMRQITKRALLYTEMVVANALHHKSEKNKLLDFYPIEHPIALQIGGNDPNLLSEATLLAEEWGYDEVNLNLGCPSGKVQKGNFGAALMSNPDHVARCIESMVKASKLPITIKHRIGIDNLDSYEFLKSFVDKIHAAGAQRFIIHARKAWLNGLNPKENRTIPPLKYDFVERLKIDRPNIKIELNGGLINQEDCLKALKKFDGAMVGRAAYSDPLHWKNIDYFIFGENKNLINASGVIKALIPYAELHLKHNGKIWDIAKHLLHLVQGRPGAKTWRQILTNTAQKSSSDLSVLEDAIKRLEDIGL